MLESISLSPEFKKLLKQYIFGVSHHLLFKCFPLTVTTSGFNLSVSFNYFFGFSKSNNKNNKTPVLGEMHKIHFEACIVHLTDMSSIK